MQKPFSGSCMRKFYGNIRRAFNFSVASHPESAFNFSLFPAAMKRRSNKKRTITKKANLHE
jgi:hypothetical protein